MRIASKSVFIILVLFNLAFSREIASGKQGGWLESNGGSEPEPLPDHSAKILLPDEDTCWEQGDFGEEITWRNIGGRYVKIDLYHNNEFVTELASWMDNTNSYRLNTSIRSAWGCGGGFQIRVENNLEPADIVWSDNFRIMAPISVTQPSNSTRWAQGQNDAQVSWTGSPGNSVKIVLYQGSEFVADISGWIQNTGSFIIPQILPSWGTGTDYHVVVQDDLGNRNASPSFRVDAINVTYPNAETNWTDGERNIRVQWEGGSRVIESIILFRGISEVLEFDDLLTNTGSYVWSGSIPASIGNSAQYRVCVTDDSGNAGWSEYFSIGISDNTIYGARNLDECSIGEFESANDNRDYWVLEAIDEYGYLISIEPNNVNINLYDEDNRLVASCFERGMLFWKAEYTGKYYVELDRNDMINDNQYTIIKEINNNSYNNANSFYGDVLNGSLLGPGDQNWWRVHVSSGKAIEILPGSDDYEVSLYNEHHSHIESASGNSILYRSNSDSDFYIMVSGSQSSTDYSIEVKKRNVYFLPEHRLTDAGLLGYALGNGGLGVRYMYSRRLFSIGGEVSSRPVYVSLDDQEYDPPIFNTQIGTLGFVLFSGANHRFELGPCVMNASYRDGHSNDSGYVQIPEIHALIEEMEKVNYGLFAQYTGYAKGSGNVRLGAHFAISYFPSIEKVFIMNTLLTAGLTLVIGHDAYR